MNFLKESFADIGGISIHWSSDCNMACKYCYIEKDKKCMASFNRDIREALNNGSFAKNIKDVCADISDQITDISLWGAEPTINGDLFKAFIYELLDFFPNTTNFMFSTNALLGGNFIYENFFIPLHDYAKEKKRYIKFNLQLSLDGPEEFNDDSRHPGATKNTLETLYTLIEKVPEDLEFITLNIFSKATLDIKYMKIMLERGIESFNWYYQFFNEVQDKAIKMLENNKKKNIYINMASFPTLVDPGFHTQEDGKALREWIKFLPYVDRTKLPHYNGKLLFYQLYSGLSEYLQMRNNCLAKSYHSLSCSASKNNITIDKDGKVYTCNRICANTARGESHRDKSVMRANSNLINTSDKQWLKKTWGSSAIHSNILSRKYFCDQILIPLALCGQVDYKYAENDDDRILIYMSLCSLLCHVGAEEDLTKNALLVPTSYLKLLGNGALDEYIKYVNLEIKRGEFPEWSIAQ